MYRNLLGILSVFAIALLLVGVTFSTTVEVPPDFRFVNGTEPKSLDPHIMTGQPEGRIADAIFEGLLYRDPRSLRPVPGVAAGMPEVSSDGMTYTFHLREDARWSDGAPITAHDFAWSWRRLQRPDLGAEYAYIHHMIQWAAEYNTFGANADAIDEEVLPAFDALLDANADGIDLAIWRAFARDQKLAESLKNVDDALLQSALSEPFERMDASQLAELRTHLAAEAKRRRDAYTYAEAHYGVDAGVFAADDHTLIVELVAPTPYFLDVVAFYSSHPVPRHVVDVPGNEQDWFLPDKIVSNGPYRLESWRVNDRIRLVKNETYWDAAHTKLDIIEALPIENGTTALNVYLTGDVDWFPSNWPPDLVDQITVRPDWYGNPGLVVYYYRFNVTREPFDDPRVRQAISMAIDRTIIVEDVLGYGQTPAYLLVPPGIAGYEPPESGLRYDPEEARRLLAEAGYPGGKNWPADVGILFNTNESHRKIAEVVADQLSRNLNIEVTPHNQEWQAYQSSMLKLDYYMARAGWIGDYLDPNTFLDMWITNGGNNQTGWGDPFYDRLIRLAGKITEFLADPEPVLARLKEPDRARDLLASIASATTTEERLDATSRLRMHLFREAEALLFQDAFPILPVYFYVVSGLVKPWVTGFYWTLEMPDGSSRPNLQDIHPLRGIGIDRERSR
ncbi:MAG: peptide ABC transporter substrate-binding protein [Planctomycetota bacterium]|jgi:oligopeptide transport system substrate-binding protein